MSEDKKSDYTEVHEEPRRMSEEDVKNYHGLTLNEQGEEYRKEAPQGGIHIEFIDVKAIPWWKKALYIRLLLILRMDSRTALRAPTYLSVARLRTSKLPLAISPNR